MLISLPAPLADAATVRLPPYTHSFTNRPILDTRTHRYNRPHNLMTRNKRILAHPPVVVDQVHIAVAHAAVRDLDFNLIGTQRTRIVFVRQ